MTAPYSTSPVYCTDEDIALRAPQDFAALCPPWQQLAKGSDGVLSGWTLTSASVDFAAAGVASGCAVRFTGPVASFPTKDLYAVDSVLGDVATLRRLGQAAGLGQPPPAATGVSYEVKSFGPQIDSASYDAKHFFHINEALPGRASTHLYDPRELQQFTVLTVLRRAYVAADKEKAGDFDLKLGLVTQELADLMARLTVHWGTLADADSPNSVMSARTRR